MISNVIIFIVYIYIYYYIISVIINIDVIVIFRSAESSALPTRDARHDAGGADRGACLSLSLSLYLYI